MHATQDTLGWVYITTQSAFARLGQAELGMQIVPDDVVQCQRGAGYAESTSSQHAVLSAHSL